MDTVRRDLELGAWGWREMREMREKRKLTSAIEWEEIRQTHLPNTQWQVLIGHKRAEVCFGYSPYNRILTAGPTPRRLAAAITYLRTHPLPAQSSVQLPLDAEDGRPA